MSSRLGIIVLLVVWIAQVVYVGAMAGAQVGLLESVVWVQVEDWQVLLVYQARQLAPGQRCGQRRGRLRRAQSSRSLGYPPDLSG
jgi:hypothetical protein